MYDFDEINDRRDSNSMKRASVHKRLTAEQRAADPLPMWVTDRSFALLSPSKMRCSRKSTEGRQPQAILSTNFLLEIPVSYEDIVFSFQSL